MAQKNVTRDMTQGSPLKLILTFSLPLLGGFLFQQLYSFMDTMVVGGVLGTEALAAVGDTGSLNFLINGFCMGICSGFAIPIAQAFGAKDETEMRRYVMHSVYLCAVISVLMGLLTGFFAPQLLRMLNTPEDILPLSVAYIQPVFFAIPVTVLYNMCGGVMRSLGDSKTPVIAITIAALLNIVLDPVFILPWGFDMGAGGAGLATFLSNCVACLYFFVLLFIKRGNTFVCIDPKKLSFQKDIVSGVCAVGIPASIQNLLNVTGMTILNNFSSSYGASAVAAIGICQKIYMVPMYISQGISQGVMPLISYTFSSNNIPRMKHVVSFARKAALTIIISVALLFFLFPGFWVELFMKDATIVEYGSHLLRRFCMGLPFLSIDFLAVGVFQAVGMGRESLLFAILRKVVLEIPALFILNALFGLYGLASAQFCAEVILATAAILVLRRLFKRLEESVPAPQKG